MLSITRWSNFSCATNLLTSCRRSSRRVQQMQPFCISTSFSSACVLSRVQQLFRKRLQQGSLHWPTDLHPVGTFDQRGVHIQLGHVIDDYSHLQLIFVSQYVLQQCGLSCPQKPAEQCNRQWLALHRHAICEGERLIANKVVHYTTVLTHRLPAILTHGVITRNDDAVSRVTDISMTKSLNSL